jgi:hypothetical protein
MPSETHASSAGQLTAPRTSALLLDFAHGFPGERVRLRDLADLLGARSFGFLLLLFALPNVLPFGIPGLSTITGVPLALVALQMMLGLPRPYLPDWLGDRSIRRDDFRRMVAKSVPWLRRVERLMKPRWTMLTNARSERILGGVCFMLAAVLCLPIPLGNLLPAIGVALLSLGILERDGALVGVGFVAGLGGVVLASGVAWGMARTATYFVQQMVA